MSAEKVGTTPTIYELTAKDGLAPFRVVMEQDYWRLLGRFQLLLALAKRYASECSECGGTGAVQVCCGSPDQSGSDDEVCCGVPDTEPCGACADLRAVIEKAEGRA